MNLEKFGSEIKQARQKKQLTQEKAAELVGISRSHYAGIEGGRISPGSETLSLIGEKLEIDLNVIKSDSDI